MDIIKEETKKVTFDPAVYRRRVSTVVDVRDKINKVMPVSHRENLKLLPKSNHIKAYHYVRQRGSRVEDREAPNPRNKTLIYWTKKISDFWKFVYLLGILCLSYELEILVFRDVCNLVVFVVVCTFYFYVDKPLDSLVVITLLKSQNINHVLEVGGVRSYKGLSDITLLLHLIDPV